MIAEIEGNIDDLINKLKMPEGEIPVLPTKNLVLFPGVMLPILVARNPSAEQMLSAEHNEKIIGVVNQTNTEAESPEQEDMAELGVYARVVKCIEMPGGAVTCIVQALGKLRVKEFKNMGKLYYATTEAISEKNTYRNDMEFKQACHNLKKTTLRYIHANEEIPDESAMTIESLNNDTILINYIASNMPFSIKSKLEMLGTNELKERIFMLLRILDRELQLIQIRNNIREKTHDELDQQQRKYFLQQQIKNIQAEMGGYETSPETQKLKAKAKLKKWSEEMEDFFNEELDKLDQINPQSSDFNVQLSYLQTLVDLPWGEYTTDDINLQRAEKVLNRDHYAMEKAKERILEYIAVLSLKKNPQAPILCLYGPPGVGKTSLGKSIATALKRKYVRVSLGGLHDEAEIRGHRRTYIGAMPGRIIKGMQKAGSSNPVFILDEIDKVLRTLITATRHRLCLKCSTLNRTRHSTTTISIATMTFREYCS